MLIRATSPTMGHPGTPIGKPYLRFGDPNYNPAAALDDLSLAPPRRDDDLRRLSLSRRQQDLAAAERRERFYALRDKGKSIAESGELMGISYSTAKKYERIRREGGARC